MRCLRTVGWSVWTARVDRRLMLAALMVVLAAADFLTAAASAYWLQLVARAAEYSRQRS